MSRWRALFGGERLPEGFAGRLDAEERLLATAAVSGDRPLVVTTHGVWLPEGRRVGWHLISKASWAGGALTLTEAVSDSEAGSAGDVVLLRDLPPRRLPLAEPGAVPETVQKRVTGSIRSRHRRELPGGGAWFVQRAVPGRDGVVLQVRPDPGADVEAVRRVATEVARRLREARG